MFLYPFPIIAPTPEAIIQFPFTIVEVDAETELLLPLITAE